MSERNHLDRVLWVADQTEAFFQRAMPGVDIARIAAFAADLMAKELTGETLAATKPAPLIRRDTHG